MATVNEGSVVEVDLFGQLQEVSKDFLRDVKDIKAGLVFQRHPFQEMQVYVLAVHKDPSRNASHRISAQRGVPLGGYVYDGVSECYLVHCRDFLPLGYIPISYTVSIKDCGNWQMTFPLPETVLKRYMSEQQKADLKRFRSNYHSEEYSFSFVQLIRA